MSLISFQWVADFPPYVTRTLARTRPV